MESIRSSVQKKIPCIFETEVVEETSSKRSQQSFKVVATQHIKEEATKSNITSAKSSEKVDGTCCFINTYNGVVWLWARLDRKPNKSAEKRFKKFQTLERAWHCSVEKEKQKPTFSWDLQKDFKLVPENWIPASGVEINEDGEPLPDKSGHTPGWLPVDKQSRQYCWHLQGVDLDSGKILVLRNSRSEDPHLEIAMVSISDYDGCTMELIGTNINGNPYKLGSKDKPIHLFVPHGEIGFQFKPPISMTELGEWFETAEGQVEGIVWQMDNGEMFKCHRHHLGLKWPVENLKLTSVPVKINIDLSAIDEENENSLFSKLLDTNGKLFSSISEVNY